jgi:hypothetical protein
MPPPPSGADHDYLTWDILSDLDRAVRDRIRALAAEKKIGQRAAARLVLKEILALGQPQKT